jgi:SAM-dependent methyltransferase
MTGHRSSPPAAWLADHRALLPSGGTALDVACGSGRHALWLAEQGFTVTALDRDAGALAHLESDAAARGVAVSARVVDLESGPVDLGAEVYDVIVAVHYLHRPLFAALRAALRPGGVLVYETFTTAQAARGRPTNPAFLLEPGELRRLVAPLEILAAREGDFEGRMIASVVARLATTPQSSLGDVPM